MCGITLFTFLIPMYRTAPLWIAVTILSLGKWIFPACAAWWFLSGAFGHKSKVFFLIQSRLKLLRFFCRFSNEISVTPCPSTFWENFLRILPPQPIFNHLLSCIIGLSPAHGSSSTDHLYIWHNFTQLHRISSLYSVVWNAVFESVTNLQ